MQRIMKKIQQVTGNEKGVSLIEVIISIMLLGIISVVFMTLIGTSSKIQQKGNNLTKNSNIAASNLEGKNWNDGTSGTPSEFKISFPGEEWTIPGYYLSSASGEISYQLFVPDSTAPSPSSSPAPTPTT